MLHIGSHVSMSGKKMFLGSVEQMLSYDANAMMIYTGAPQNTKRKPIEELLIDEAHQLLSENNISLDNVIIHAPYIINLANTVKPETFEIAVSFLREEIKRTQAMGAKYIVLHPGAHVGAGSDAGLKQIVKGLNEVITSEQDVIICLETMAGKGTELGSSFEELAYIINNVDFPEKLGVCLDTCHIHDAGYNLHDFDNVLAQFEENIGLDRLYVIHVNDSKNILGAAKDRHENLGYGEIGFEILSSIVNHPSLDRVVKVLETPYVDDKKIAPYKEEIAMLRAMEFKDWLDEERKIK